MRIVLVALSVTAAAIVGGCSTGAQREAARIQSVENATAASSVACVQGIADDPKFASLKTKTVLDPNPQFPLQMINDATKPTKKEISLLYELYGAAQQCRKEALDGASKGRLPVSIS